MLQLLADAIEMIILAIDIGNSRTKLGVWKGKKLAGTLNVPGKKTSPKDIRHQVDRVLRQAGVQPDTLSGTVISSVVPHLRKRYSTIVKLFTQAGPLIVSSRLDVGLRILYRNPHALGADRICGAVAAFHNYGGPVIVVDAGTAMTYNVITKDGRFLGGAIFPGVYTAASALHQRTARLLKIELRFPANVIGKTTVENLQSGILYGTIDALDGMLKRIKKVTGRSTKVVLTGGYSSLIGNEMSAIGAIEPALVLEGARLIYERTRTSGN